MAKAVLEQVQFSIPADILQKFREKMDRELTISRETGRPATEDELVLALMKFYIQGDIVLI